MSTHDTQKKIRIYFTGVGGQGTLTATTLLARTALDAGLDVVAGEVHGMAQRGGVVESVLLLGGWRSPKLDLGEADLLLGFEPLETLRGLPYLRPGGAIFSNSDPLPPLSVSLGQTPYPDLAHIEAKAKDVAGHCRFLHHFVGSPGTQKNHCRSPFFHRSHSDKFVQSNVTTHIFGSA